MIETWLQWTCDGCGETGGSMYPNMTKKDLIAYLRSYGWVSKKGKNYCPACVESGQAKKLASLYSEENNG